MVFARGSEGEAHFAASGEEVGGVALGDAGFQLIKKPSFVLSEVEACTGWAIAWNTAFDFAQDERGKGREIFLQPCR
jgi:hypothetical protein